ncbi:hypothetical protein OHB26_17200 [Nocardia sp. NBC_01503]|uniref:hypothetical protein n=1 Tax=Nocardia TaxID=1817 RepID=UPI0008352956|nr:MULTISPECIES: hypothetical protein [Nocardia]WTL35778.1 hypothetical protein OHB26_17200 [Nocardia sp. NBC_01503]
MEWLLGLLGGVVGGGVGGSKNPLGPVVNGGLGAVGGGITGVIIQAATSGGLDFGQILAQVAGGGIVGAVLSAITGFATRPKAGEIR